MSDIVQVLARLQRASLRGQRGNAMTPLGAYLAVVLAGMSGSLAFDRAWVTSILLGLFVLGALAFVSVFVYFALRNTDALRSERYHLEKLAIEKAAVGDSIRGLEDEAPTTGVLVAADDAQPHGRGEP